MDSETEYMTVLGAAADRARIDQAAGRLREIGVDQVAVGGRGDRPDGAVVSGLAPLALADAVTALVDQTRGPLGWMVERGVHGRTAAGDALAYRLSLWAPDPVAYGTLVQATSAARDADHLAYMTYEFDEASIASPVFSGDLSRARVRLEELRRQLAARRARWALAELDAYEGELTNARRARADGTT